MLSRLAKCRSLIPLPVVLVVPVVLQILGAAGLVGYLSYRNGQRAVSALAQQLQQEVSTRVDTHLSSYLALPHQINALNLDAIDRGLLDLKDQEGAGRHFWQQSQVFPQFSLVYYYLADDTAAAAGRWLDGYDVVVTQHPPGQPYDYTYATNGQGDRTELVDKTEYSGSQDSWYIDTVLASEPSWTRINTSVEYGDYITASATVPIYDANRLLLGALGVDLKISAISEFLQDVRLAPVSQIFILERDGRLVASSGKQAIAFERQGEVDRHRLTTLPDPQLQAVGQALEQQFPTLYTITSPQSFQIRLDGQTQFVRVAPWQDEYGLDWLVVVTLPQSAFTAEINASTRSTIMLCVAATVGASAIALVTTHWITRPVLALNQAAHAMVGGNLSAQVPPSPIHELHEMGQAFNTMALQLQSSFATLAQNNAELEARVAERTQALSQNNAQLQITLEALHQTQSQMIQAEKMSALGKMVAGVAHEINNPVSFIHGNLAYAQAYIQDLLSLIEAYQAQVPQPNADLQAQLEGLDLPFVKQDLAKILASMQTGTERIKQIVLSLRTFSRLDEADCKTVDLTSGIDSALLILHHRLQATAQRPEIQIIKRYGDLPPVECYAGELNQVFVNIFSNAIDALDEVTHGWDGATPTLEIDATCDGNWVTLCIADNGVGISEAARSRIFDPFFTTKPVGKGTGLGLAVSYQIVTKRHGGKLYCTSTPAGTEFHLAIPVQQQTRC